MLSGEHSADRDWGLSDHRMQDGTAVMPGTGYLRLMAAGWHSLGLPRPFALRQAAFLQPLIAPEGSALQVRLRLRPDELGHACEIESQLGEAEPVLHATALLAASAPPPPAAIDSEALRARMLGGRAEPGRALRSAQELHLQLGPRFRCLRAAYFGAGEPLGELALDAALSGDVFETPLHAGLLDLGTGFAMQLVPDYAAEQGLWAPLSYAKLELHAQLPARCFAWVRTHGRARAAQGTLAFDATLCAPDGSVCVQVHELTLRKLAQGTSLSGRGAAPRRARQNAVDRAFERSLAQGISPEEGVRALQRVLSGAAPSCVLISPRGPRALRKASAALTEAAAAGAARFARPEHSEYVPARILCTCSSPRSGESCSASSKSGFRTTSSGWAGTSRTRAAMTNVTSSAGIRCGAS